MINSEQTEESLLKQIHQLTGFVGEAERLELPCVRAAIDLPGLGRRYVEIHCAPEAIKSLS